LINIPVSVRFGSNEEVVELMMLVILMFPSKLSAEKALAPRDVVLCIGPIVGRPPMTTLDTLLPCMNSTKREHAEAQMPSVKIRISSGL
jgi:hypothetical protein